MTYNDIIATQYAEDYDEDEDVRPQTVHVNLDSSLLLLLREMHYLAREPFNLKLPGSARELLRNTNAHELRVVATRLETIVSKYNTVMKSLSEFEQPLFERSLAKIDNVRASLSSLSKSHHISIHAL